MNVEPGQIVSEARGLRRWWPYLAVAALVFVLGVIHISRFTSTSPIDESRHVDYMAKVTQGEVPRLGDLIGNETMRIEACRGIELPEFDPPPCSTRDLHPRSFRDKGYTNVTGHPPLYYLVTGAPARALAELGIAGSILDPARVAGLFWLMIGLFLTVRAAEVLGVRRVPTVCAIAIVVAAPSFLTSHGTVNPDAASVFAGGLVLLLAVLWERYRVPTWALGIAGGVAAALKMTNFAIVAVVALWLLSKAWCNRYRPNEEDAAAKSTTRRLLVGAGVLVGSALAVTVAWIAVGSARALIDPLQLPSNAQFYQDAFPWGVLPTSANLFAMFTPVNDWTFPALRVRGTTDVQTVTQWILIAGMLVGLLRVSIRDRISVLAAWTAVVLLAGSSGFMLLTWVINRVVFSPASRYGLSTIPVLVIAAATLVRGRVGTLVMATFAALAVSVTLSSMVV
jgi:hypothetical protein